MPKEPSTGNRPNSDASSRFAPPQIALPKGGGAIRDIGEKFTANPATGTGSLSIPIPISRARSGFDPELSLAYDSGSGNGAFGIGWNLTLPSISRKTDKGIPQYRDQEESDVFLISDAEDLVPVLDHQENDDWVYAESERYGYEIKLYRPRVEGLFARIERWTRIQDGEGHWRSFSKDNVLTVYGASTEARISDPDHPGHVFKWLISSTYDVRGNAIVYEYVPENDCGVDVWQPGEHRRKRSANRYLKRIRYGNRKPVGRNRGDMEYADWMFEVVFDFGEEAYRECSTDVSHESTVETATRDHESFWPARRDAFSTYRSGFEIRTHRLCRRILSYHHFSEDLPTPRYLVRSTELQYHEKAIGSFLTCAVQSGYTFEAADRYLKRSLPALNFAYTPSPLEEQDPGPFKLVESDSRNLPQGIDGTNYRWLDLDGEGISGVLSEQGTGWYYKHNLGKGNFGPPKLVSGKPSATGLDSGRLQLMDVAGEGVLNLVDFSTGSAGFYERSSTESRDERWEQFRAFQFCPVLDWSDSNLRFVDVTGDGVADVLVTEDVAIRWHPSLLKHGFGAGVRIPAPHDENEGARVVFADRTQSIYLADMSGDGLSDIVRIRNGEVSYWPNVGYGRFGAKVTMDRSPWFDTPNLFDQRRIRLADTDGSGTTDILYLGDDGVYVYLNECGNAWSERRILRGVPMADARSISVTDFLGRGTACLVWSSPLPADAQRPLRYVDLMRGRKPHLLTRIANNLGVETLIEYASSTEFYLADQAAGQPWVTRLPFPVHVVKRIETYDYVSRNRFVSTSTYHHGYYDGVEREFRGFGRVDETDTEEFGVLRPDSAFSPSTNEEAAWNVPPILSRTWYHTGVFLGMDRVSCHMAHEYYREPHETSAMKLEDTVLPPELTPEEAREACRALKGSMLRQEMYALDHSEATSRPYVVNESNFTIRLSQPRGPNRHSVFFTHPREGLNFNYERKLYYIAGVRRADPRVSHNVVLEADDYGNILQSASISYGRRFPDPSPLLSDCDREKQCCILATLTNYRFTNAVKERDDYRTPLPAEERSYELIHLHPRAHEFGVTNLLRFADLRRQIEMASDGRHDLPFEDFRAARATEPVPYRRLFHESRTIYRSDQLDCLLPLGEVQPMALPGDIYALAFSSSLIDQVYRRPNSESVEELLPDPVPVLQDDCAFIDLDNSGHWWASSGRVFYSPDENDDSQAELDYAKRHFFIARRFRDPFGNSGAVTYDIHDLAPVKTSDALGNTVHASIDYRLVRPWQVTDANGNRTAVAFDTLGMVTGSAVMGKEGQQVGDSLTDFQAELPNSVALEHLRHPLQDPQAILGNATTRFIYDLFAFERTRADEQPQPVASYTAARETHLSDLAPGQQTKVQHSFCYYDGFGREIQRKIQAEPGPVPGHTGSIDSRWTGSGWTIFNNKGKPVRQYEPYFSNTHHFEFAVIVGVSPTLFYDPVERVAATLHPNHTYEKVIFDPWRQETWDVNDTVLLTDPLADTDVADYLQHLPTDDYSPTWYSQRIDGQLGRRERDSATKTAAHANTPAISYFDSLGRVFLTIADNGADGEFATRVELDIEGNERSITDALGRKVVVYVYDILGNRIHDVSMEAGARWTLNDVAGHSTRVWDNRGQNFRTVYDVLRRPTSLFIHGTDRARSDPRTLDGEILYQKTDYGETHPDGQALNLRTRIFQTRDTAGIATNVGRNPVTDQDEGFDFKGNLLRSTRQFVEDYKSLPNWSAGPPQLQPDVFRTSSEFDALNRPTAATTPDGSDARPTYNEANLIETVSVHLRGDQNATVFVSNIDYDAKGQRVLIEFGNGARTTYAYDPLTFRLTHMRTERGSAQVEGDTDQESINGKSLQDLSYTFDPVGNITHIRDHSQQMIYFRNKRVDPSNEFTFDPTYRLIKATGREHLGLHNGGGPLPPIPGSWRDSTCARLPFPGDGNAMGTYAEEYHYDPIGNFLSFIHRGRDPSNPGWKRNYSYHERSYLEPEKVSNRLTSTTVTGARPLNENYSFDVHGNMTAMPHLPVMAWNFHDQLTITQRQVVNDDGPDGGNNHGERVYYVYDAQGLRVRKVIEGPNGQKRNERTYLNDFEVYREYEPGGEVRLLRDTLHVLDDRRRIALVETKTFDASDHTNAQPSSVRYQFDNHLGSACLELDHTGAVISYEEYYPFGGTSYQAGRSVAEVSLKRYRYNGKERDEQTGFYYYGARYLIPWLGRWASPDPAGLVDGPNRYAFVKDNPAISVDAEGKQAGPYTPIVMGKQLEKATSDVANDVGAPGFGESLIPIWGSGRSAIHSFQTGHWGWGIVHTALAVSDVFLVKSIATAAGKVVIKGVGKILITEAVTKEGTTIAIKEGADEAAQAALKEAAAKEAAAKEAAAKEAAAKQAAQEEAAKEAAAKEAAAKEAAAKEAAAKEAAAKEAAAKEAAAKEAAAKEAAAKQAAAKGAGKGTGKGAGSSAVKSAATKGGSSKSGATYVYRSINPVTKQVQYVGITNNLARRAAEHLAQKGIVIERVMVTATRADARAVEQTLVEVYRLGKEGGTLLNKINSIAKTNPVYAQQLRRGYQLLQSIGYK